MEISDTTERALYQMMGRLLMHPTEDGFDQMYDQLGDLLARQYEVKDHIKAVEIIERSYQSRAVNK